MMMDSLNLMYQRLQDGATLVTANQRLARHHRVGFDQWQVAQGRSWWESPSIMPYRAWVSDLHQVMLSLSLTDRVLVPPLLVQNAWLGIIERDSEVSLLDNHGAMRVALSAWQLSHAWHCYNPDPMVLSEDQKAWQRWAEQYRRWLDEQHAVDMDLLPALLTEHIRTLDRRASWLPSVVVLDGFVQIPPQVEALTGAMSDVGVEISASEAVPQACISTVEYADNDVELLGIATQMRAELERSPGCQLGLVVPDLERQRTPILRAFSRIFYPALSPEHQPPNERPYELSLGESLAAQPVVDAALLALRLCVTELREHELSALLLCRFLVASEPEMARRQQLDLALRNRRLRRLTLDQLAAHLYPFSRLEPVLAELQQQPRHGQASLSTWAERFNHWLSCWGWPGKSIGSEEYQAVSRWHECLDDLQQLDHGDAVSSMAALSMLERLAREHVFQPERTRAPIQIMGRLESHGLSFDTLWVTGLDSEQWPPDGSPTPFLAFKAQKACGIPQSSALGRLQLAESEMAWWASRCELLIATHATVREGQVVSAAVLPVIEPVHEPAPEILERMQRLQVMPEIPDPLLQLAEQLSVVSIRDDLGPPLQGEAALVRGGSRVLESQALCPFRGFALHRLVIRPFEEPGLGLDARQHGTLLHKALELFWQRTRNQAALQELFDNGALVSVLSEVIAEALQMQSLSDELRVLEQQRLEQLLHEWLVNCELQREPFDVLAFEQRNTIVRQGVAMEVIMDRVDSVGGARVLIDYKTGKTSLSSWAEQRISNPQLPLYVLNDGEIQAASFARVASGQCAFSGLGSDSALLPGLKMSVARRAENEPPADWHAWREHWQQALDSVALEVRDGIAVVSPMKGACHYCELKPLCRIDAHESTDASDSTANDMAGAV